MHSGIITHAFRSHEALIVLETTTGDQVLGNSLLACMHRNACLLYASVSPVMKLR